MFHHSSTALRIKPPFLPAKGREGLARKTSNVTIHTLGRDVPQSDIQSDVSKSKILLDKSKRDPITFRPKHATMRHAKTTDSKARHIHAREIGPNANHRLMQIETPSRVVN